MWQMMGEMKTHDIAQFAKDNNYEGVKINNVVDGGTKASNVVVYFDSTSLKSADTITYDDKGNVIPLSERFNPKNKDIRYSDRDTLGNSLSKEQVDFFKDSKVRDENGNLMVMYHGTPNGNFNTFQISDGAHNSLMAQYGAGYYFDASKDSAKRYTQNVNKTSGIKNPKVFETYLNIKNPLVIHDEYLNGRSPVITKQQFRDVISKGNYEWFFTNGMPFELTK